MKDRKVATTTATAKPVFNKPLTVSTSSLIECTEQSGSKKVDDNKEVTVPVHKGRKIATTTADAKLAGRKLLMALAKGALEKDVRDLSMRKV